MTMQTPDFDVDNSKTIKAFSGNREIANSAQAELEQMFAEVGLSKTDEKSDAQEVPSTVQSPVDEKGAQQEENDFFQTAKDNLAEVVPSIGHGVARFAQEAANFAMEAGQFIAEGSPGFAPPQQLEKQAKFDFANNPDFIYQPETTTGQLISGATQFLAPFSGVTKAMKGMQAASAGAKFMKSSSIGSIVDFAFFDPHEERMSNLLQQFPMLQNPFTEYLSANPKDSRAEGRFKNALEGFGLGFMVEGLVSGVKAIRAWRMAKNSADDAVKMEAKLLDRSDELGPQEKPDKAAAAEGATSEGVDQAAPEDNTQKIVDEVKAEVKSERPSQKEVPTIKISETVAGPEDLSQQINQAKNLKDVKRLQQKLTEQFKLKDTESAQVAGRGPLSADKISEFAENIGMTPEKLLERRKGQVFSAEEVFAAESILDGQAKIIDDINQQYRNAAEGSDERRVLSAKLMDEYNFFVAMRDQFTGAGSEAGRSLNAFKQVLEGRNTAQINRAIDEIININGGHASIDVISKGLAKAGDSTKKIGKIAERSTFQSLVRAAHESFINSILSGLSTHAINFASNTGNVVLRVADTATGRVVGKVRKAVFGTAEADIVQAGEAAAQARGAVEGVKETGSKIVAKAKRLPDFMEKSKARLRKAFEMPEEEGYIKATFNAFGEMSSIMSEVLDGTVEGADVLGKVEYHQPAITAENFGAKGNLGKAVDLAGSIIRTPGNALQTSDEFFKLVNKRGSIHQQAIQKAQIEGAAKNWTPKEINARYDELVKNPTEAMEQAAIDASREATYTQQLRAGGVADRFDKLVKSNSAMKWMVPFVRTPSNIIQNAVEHTPIIGLLSPNTRRALKAGGREADIAIAKMTNGLMLIGSSAMLTTQGVIVGNPPANRASKEAWQLSNQKDSIKINGKFYGFDRFDPFGMLIGVGADLAQMGAYMYSDERSEEFNMLSLSAAAVIAENYSPEFMTRNFRDFLTIIGGDETGMNKASRVARKTIANIATGTLIPFSAAFRDLRKEVDPIKRDTRVEVQEKWKLWTEMKNNIMNTIPGLSENLPPRRDMFGRPVHYNPGQAPTTSNAVDVAVQEDNALNRELLRLSDKAPTQVSLEKHEVFSIMPPTRKIEKNNVRVRLNDEQYDKLQLLSAGVGLKAFGGETLEERLAFEVENNYPGIEYAPKNDINKKRVLKKIINTYRKAARAQLIMEDSTVMDELMNKSSQLNDAHNPTNFSGR